MRKAKAHRRRLAEKLFFNVFQYFSKAAAIQRRRKLDDAVGWGAFKKNIRCFKMFQDNLDTLSYFPCFVKGAESFAGEAKAASVAQAFDTHNEISSKVMSWRVGSIYQSISVHSQF